MRVLILDVEAPNMLDLAMRASAAGHEVRWWRWTANPNLLDGKGFKGFEIIQEWQPSMPWARDGLIIATSNKRHIHNLDRYREMGYKIFGPTIASAKLEVDRGAGMDLIRSIGHELPPYTQFNSLEEAEAFARKSDRAWVHKPMGDEDDKSLTYVSRDQADMCGWLRRQIKRGKKLKGPCLLQEKIDKLSEVGVSGWMGPEGFLRDKWQVCFEHKPLMNDNVGPATGEQGTVMQYTDNDKLAEEMLMPLEPALRALGHTGDFAVGAMIDTKGNAHFLEFTARMGYPAFWIQIASHRGDPVKWMRDLLDSKDTLKVSYDVAIGVVMTQPLYPFADSNSDSMSPKDLIEGSPIHGVEGVLKDVHLVSAMIDKGPI